MIPSRAKSENTIEYCSRFPELLSKNLGSTDLRVSACGFGAYRTDYRVKEHSKALEYALSSGINLIDTSSNYSDGGSEILIGSVLEELVNKGKIKREEIVVVSKGGYIQGKNLQAARKLKDTGHGYKEMTEYAENIWHCIHPDFLKDQITLSLERLNLNTIDVYLLHNPEYFLDSPAAKDLELDEIRHEYYRRIKKAFEHLEEEAAEGRIGCYGISSNSFVKASDDPVFTSFQYCNDAANELSRENLFKVIEFPLNLSERGAVTEKNQLGDTAVLVDHASERGFGMLVNRPLNALGTKGLTRLADFPVNSEYTSLDETQIVVEINLLESMEEDFIREELELTELSAENKKAVDQFLRAGALLKENWKNFGSIESLNDLKKQYLIPRVNYAITALVSSPSASEEVKDKLDKIAKQTNKLMGIMDSIYGLKANFRSKDLHMKLNTIVDAGEADRFSKLSLSQKAILFINSIDPVSCTLAGMRQEKYVDDVLTCLKSPVLMNIKEKWAKLN